MSGQTASPTENGRVILQDGQRRVSPPAGQPNGDEADLIRAAQAGSRPAFASLIERYWDRLYRWLCRLTRNPTAAEDIAQETFLKAFAALPRFKAGTNFRAWLFRIAHNNFVNHKRADRHDRQPLVPEAAEEPRGPVAETLTREALAVIADAIQRLPAEFRGALLLRIDEDLSFREIAKVLKITEETARWRVFKARQKLMSLLTPEMSAPNEPKSP